MTVKEIVEQRRAMAGVGAEVRCGDVIDVLRTLPANHFDACLTDPPYGLEFMGKGWDKGVPPVEVWLEVLRVLKPGAMLLAFGGTRTYHRLACAIEDAGFEVRDCLMWLYGSGFPKSMDIGKALDKQAGAVREVVGISNSGPLGGRKDGSVAGSASNFRDDAWVSAPVNVITAPATDAAKLWDGYGTALKPAWEPIILAMKPLAGTFAENALAWGVAGLNIAACRIGVECRTNGPASPTSASRKSRVVAGYRHDDGIGPGSLGGEVEGRWPANLMLDEEAAAMLDEQSGVTKSSGGPSGRLGGKGIYGSFTPMKRSNEGGLGDVGGASRFFYCAKASRSERGPGNTHPTVKPLNLCEYLARLLLPPARSTPHPTPRRILVPFSGSGSEMIGSLRTGWDGVLGIDNNREYCQLSRQRMTNDKGD